MKDNTSMMAAGLSMQNISHAFGQHRILNDISIEVPNGQIACLLGPSGCGKTTLLRIAAGLEPLQSGKIIIDGRSMSKSGGRSVPPEKRNIGLMFQDFALFPHLNVVDNISFGIKGSLSERKRWIVAGLDKIGLAGYADHFPHELSGGQQQRIALLRALAPEPSVLLLDEPFSGLDATRRASVREQTLEFLKESGLSALMVTHDPEEAMFMSDNLLIMDKGQLIQSGPPIEIYSHPKNSFVATLFGQIDVLDGRVNNDGLVETSLGNFAANQIAPGTLVDVLIRPEGISPCKKSHITTEKTETVSLRVVGARPIGRSSHLRLTTLSGVNSSSIIRARVPGIFLPETGSLIDVKIDPAYVFVFAKQDQTP